MVLRIVQSPRSLLITKGRAYRDYLHRIPHTARDSGLSEDTVHNWRLLSRDEREGIERNDGCLDRKLRVSLTIRDVVKVKRILRLGRTR